MNQSCNNHVFQSFQNSKTFTIKTNSDSEPDDNEYFSVDLFMEATSDQSYAHQKVYINDVAISPTHTYTVTNNSSDGSGVNEGNDVVFTIKRTSSSASESTVFIKTLQGKANEDDLIQNNILIDKQSASLLKGSEIDYVEELIGESFKINNPQTKSSCGCGVSFSL